MNFKKTIAKSLVVAMALGMVPVANLQTAKAAAAAIQFSGETGIAKSAGAKFWGLAKVDAKGGKGSVKIGDKFYKITNVQEYYDEIDAYSALKGKAGILAAGDKAVPDGTWVVSELPAADNTFKAQVIASKGAIKGAAPAHTLGGEFGYLYGTIGKKPVKEVDWTTSKASIEVKLNDGSWKDFETFFGTADNDGVTKKLKVYGQNGSTLTFRIKGSTTAWASKESKVKLAAQAKAPSVKIDVNKDTTSIKSGMEYQVVTVGNDPTANWTAATDKKGVSLATLNLTDTKDVLVRTAASAKKIASKVTRITVNKPAAALTVPSLTGTGAAIKQGASDIVAVVEANLAYDITKGASLKNVSTNDIEYAVVRANTPADKVKWSTLKASKDPVKKPTKANLKYSATPKDNTWGDATTKLFVRLAGTKQTKDNVATQSGVSAGAVMGLTNIAQAFKFVAGSSTDNTTGSELTANANSTAASIKVATGAAAKFTIKANISNVVNTKASAPKVKATNLPKGVTFKVGKVDPATGNFDIEINVSKSTFKTEVPTVTADFSLKFEGVNGGFKVSFEKK